MKRPLGIALTTVVLLSIGAVAPPTAQAAAPIYSVALLQPLPGNQDSFAYGINNRGDVVGASEPGTTDDAEGGGTSTLWRAGLATGTAVAASLPKAQARDIAGDGTVIGVHGLNPDEYESDAYWSRSGKVTASALLLAHSISHGGKATGYTDDGPATAVPNGTPKLLPAPEGTAAVYVGGISDNGRVVGGVVADLDSEDSGRPAVWFDDTPRVLQTPAGSEGLTPPGVNDRREAVACVLMGGRAQPYKWSADGRATKLPMPSGYSSACPTVINDSGVAAGSLTGAAAVWLDGAAYWLGDLLAPAQAGLDLGHVVDINSTGQLVGTARLDDGSFRGYIATPISATTLYTTPGYHHFNGRDWRTTCEPYSQTTRCRTEIIATQVVYSGGQYSRVTDWAFNNLTYTPSARSLWTNNPLGRTGEWTATDGRKWRTECDTAATGNNGCRSYVEARVAAATAKPGGGYTYTVETKWVLNNIVKFS